MLRILTAIGVLLPLLLAAPASAVTSKQKMDTCKFGADNQKLTGKKRSQFISRCMANRDDPRGKPISTDTQSAPKADDKDTE